MFFLVAAELFLAFKMTIRGISYCRRLRSNTIDPSRTCNRLHVFSPTALISNVYDPIGVIIDYLIDYN